MTAHSPMPSWLSSRQPADPAGDRHPHGRVLPLLTVALALAIFLFDTFSPMKIAVAVLYAIVIFMAVGLVDRRGILTVALACVGLTIVGFAAGAERPGFEAHLLRGLVSLSAIAIATLLAIRNQAAAAVLGESERRWRTIFQAVGVSIWEEDFSRVRRAFDDLARQGVSDFRRHLEDDPHFVERCISLVEIVDINDAVIRLLGAADKAEVLAQRRRFFLPETVVAYRELLIALAEGRPSYAGESALQTIAGERRSILITATFPADGTRISGLISAVDITERNRVERALAQARAELAHVSRFITLGELAASVAHEVKQPLAAIVTNGQACLRWLDRPAPDLAEARACAERIVGEGGRADHVIQRLRSLARKADPERLAVDVNAIVDEVVELMQRDIADHQVALRLDLAPDLPPVLADRVQLQQVLINLVINALQAMGPLQAMGVMSGRELSLETRRDQAGDVLVSVGDSGVGLDEEAMAHLFAPFYTTKSDGMGMGLSICRSIIESHGGRIWATRNAGAGAAFHFVLPVTRRRAA